MRTHGPGCLFRPSHQPDRACYRAPPARTSLSSPTGCFSLFARAKFLCIKKLCDQRAGGLTNGRGMMLFSRGFMKFAGGLPVVPVALRVTPALGIRTHTLTSSFLANLFWFSVPPYLEIEATVLPALPPFAQVGSGGGGQLAGSKGAYVQRAQQAIADELGIPVVNANIKDKRKLMQRNAQQQQQR